VRANEKRLWALGDALEEIGPSHSPHRVRCEPGYPEHLADLITELEDASVAVDGMAADLLRTLDPPWRARRRHYWQERINDLVRALAHLRWPACQ
jgi:hypothetical protein